MKKTKILMGLSLFLGLSISVAFGDEADAARSMHRLYNPNSGEHFYTADTNEKNVLVNKHRWKYEGVAWTAPDVGNNVYRVYNPNSGEHHYTMGLNEKNFLVKLGWRYEGVGWKSDTYKGQALYRLYNPNAGAGAHHYTKDMNERKHLLKVGWKNENIGWYGMNPNQQMNITIIHKGNDGKVLNKSVVKVKRDTNYTAKGKSFNGYSIKGSSSQKVKADGNKTITFNYIKNAVKPPSAQKFTIKTIHLGSDGKTLKSYSTVIEKGKSYTAKAESFSGYTLKGNNSKTITVNGNTNIVFNYTKNTVAPTKFKVSVQYKEKNGKLLTATIDTATVEKGKQYIATARTFDGYVVEGSKTQTITVNQDTLITFNYLKNVPTVNKTELQNLYNSVKGKVKGNYTDTSWKTFQNSLNIAKNILDNTNATQTQVDNAKNALQIAVNGLKENPITIQKFNVTVVHKDTNGTTLQTENTVQIEKGKTFTAKAKVFNGYTLQGQNSQTITVNGNATITFTYKKDVVEDLLAIENQLNNQALVNINNHRSSNGKAKLTFNSALQKAATVRSRELPIRWDHKRPNGSDSSTAAEEAGYDKLNWNENIYKGNGMSLNWIKTNGAQLIVNAWINSPEHNGTLLSGYNIDGAVGVYIKDDGGGRYSLYASFMPGEKRLGTRKTQNENIEQSEATQEESNSAKEISSTEASSIEQLEETTSSIEK
ncbi:MucBP domain-containing protein [Enterococcus sp. DIV0187]|uniref:MucBP domain-containing protein n=1 Tax=Enterococcus sp. DIV0187 TaxID=2774644 RepID=UPI003F2165ED